MGVNYCFTTTRTQRFNDQSKSWRFIPGQFSYAIWMWFKRERTQDISLSMWIIKYVSHRSMSVSMIGWNYAQILARNAMLSLCFQAVKMEKKVWIIKLLQWLVFSLHSPRALPGVDQSIRGRLKVGDAGIFSEALVDGLLQSCCRLTLPLGGGKYGGNIRRLVIPILTQILDWGVRVAGCWRRKRR